MNLSPFQQGREAERRGWARVSPYLDGERSLAWECGFDGLSADEMAAEIAQQFPKVAETIAADRARKHGAPYA